MTNNSLLPGCLTPREQSVLSPLRQVGVKLKNGEYLRGVVMKAMGSFRAPANLGANNNARKSTE